MDPRKADKKTNERRKAYLKNKLTHKSFPKDFKDDLGVYHGENSAHKRKEFKG